MRCPFQQTTHRIPLSEMNKQTVKLENAGYKKGKGKTKLAATESHIYTNFTVQPFKTGY